MSQKELFANYEFDGSERNHIILKILGGSLLVHLLLVVFVLFVPVVRDAFYVASLFSDAPTGWKNGDYTKTNIEEGDTATVFSLPPTDQLQYPAGYFALANGDAPAPDMLASTTPYNPEIVSTDNGVVEGFPGLNMSPTVPAPTPFPMPAPPMNAPIPNYSSSLPKLKKLPKNRKLPTFEEVNGKNNGANADGSIPGIPQTSPTAKVEPNKDTAAKATPLPAASPSPGKEGGLNAKPLEDLAAVAIAKINNREIDLNKPVNVSIKGVLDDKGKLVAKQTTYKNNGGDEQLAQMAVALIGAMNDSGMLEYIKALNDGSSKREVIFNISKDEKDVKFQLVSAVGDNAKANSIASGLGIAFDIFKAAKKGSEEGDLLEGVKLTTDKNQVIINWGMDTPTAIRKINNKLAQVKAKQSSVQTAAPTAQTTVK